MGCWQAADEIRKVSGGSRALRTSRATPMRGSVVRVVLALRITLRPALVMSVVVMLSASCNVRRTDFVPRTIEAGAVYVASEGIDRLGNLNSYRLAAVLDLDAESVIPSVGSVARDWRSARDKDLRFVTLPLHATSPPSVQELQWAVNILADTVLRPILVTSDGNDGRVDMVVAAYRVRIQHWPIEQALAELTNGSLSTSAALSRWTERLREYAALTAIADEVRRGASGAR